VGPTATPLDVTVGRKLFFDTRLSANGTISCASCHIPEKAFSDGLSVAKGLNGQRGTRNTPSLWNVAFAADQFWDGRRTSLEQQAIDPLLNPREHGLKDVPKLLAIIRADPVYRREFDRGPVGGAAITRDVVARALASFERTLIAGGSPFDRYLYGGDSRALSDSAARGLALFRGRAQCATCHTIGEHFALFSDDAYHRLGVGMTTHGEQLAAAATQVANATPAQLDHLISENADVAALGRFVVTKRPRDIGLFKTPSLRNVALTAPYMHDGSVNTLLEALDIEVYYRGFEANRPLILTPQEKSDLIAFLEALTSPSAAQCGVL
jgi:cytochrome c peroxidase